ncbi:MAG: hypothetical protein Q7R79_02905 [bacterium]|nr:hypothetical protein [bacterium]
MDLLHKTVTDVEHRREDNSDKKPLFAKENHPHPANYHKEQWAFIGDTALCENIAYQMQYLEFMVALYNNYQIYLTVESLLCKDILATVGGVVEAALFDMIQTARTNGGLSMITRTDFTALLGEAYHGFNIIDKNTWHYFHELRKVRNYVHLKAADFREHTAYTVDEANEAITQLEKLRHSLSGK